MSMLGPLLRVSDEVVAALRAFLVQAARDGAALLVSLGSSVWASPCGT